MKLLGLHGKPGAGKDTFADRLVARHRFIKRGFSDALYEEVADAFGVTAEWLQDRKNKDLLQPCMALICCKRPERLEFFKYVPRGLSQFQANTPRDILHWWGTEYRRAENPNYWLDKMGDFVGGPPEDDNDLRGAGVVIRDVRFPNEAEWVRARGGKIFEIVRPKYPADYHEHVSERRLPDDLIDVTVYNGADVIWLGFCADFYAHMEAAL